VTHRELALVVAPIDRALERIEQEQRRFNDHISAELSELRAHLRSNDLLIEQRSFLGGRGRSVMNSVLVAGPAALISAFFTYFLPHR
jgi:hypothetical protein